MKAEFYTYINNQYTFQVEVFNYNDSYPTIIAALVAKYRKIYHPKITKI